MLFPDAVEQHVETMCRFLEAGVNVVSTSNLITGRWWGAKERFDAAGKAGGASLFAGGVNPGFVEPARADRDRRLQRGQAHLDLGGSRVLGLRLARPLGVRRRSLTTRRARLLDLFKRGTTVFEDAVAMMADALDLPLDEVRYVPEVARRDRDLDLGFMFIPKGHVAGLRNRWLGIADGVEVIELGSIWKMTEDVEPNWPIRHGWHFQVDGTPTVKMHVAGWPP